jgi:hypothetical protein
MNICNSKHELNGCIEFDEGFFERVDNKEVIENKNNLIKTATKRGKALKYKQKYWLW